MEPVFNTCGSLSVLGSFSIMLTCYNFPTLIQEGRLYMQIILLISLSDFCGSLAFSFGYVSDPAQCAWQGGLIIFFFRATWLWTLALSHQLYCLVKDSSKPPPLTFRKLNVAIWTTNILAECLPLLIPHGLRGGMDNVQYGTDDERYGDIVCTFSSIPSVKTANHVAIAVLFVPLLIALCGMVYYCVRVFFHFRSMKLAFQTLHTPLLVAIEAGAASHAAAARCEVEAQSLLEELEDEDGTGRDAHALSVESSGISEAGWCDQTLLDKLSSIAFVLSLYPIALFVCWVPLFVAFIAANGLSHEEASFSQDPAKYMEVISLSLASLHGGVLACIFFTHSPRARRMWAHWLQSKYPCVYSALCCCAVAPVLSRGGKEAQHAAAAGGGQKLTQTRVSWF